MNRKLNHKTWYLSVLTAFCIFATKAVTAGQNQTAASKEDDIVAAASMIHLLTDPEFFSGRRVNVFGYVGGLSSGTLYLTEAHADANDVLSSIKISKPFLTGEDCHAHYAYVVGEVKIEPFVPYSLVSLINIESIKIADGPEGDKFQLCYEAKP